MATTIGKIATGMICLQHLHNILRTCRANFLALYLWGGRGSIFLPSPSTAIHCGDVSIYASLFIIICEQTMICGKLLLFLFIFLWFYYGRFFLYTGKLKKFDLKFILSDSLATHKSQSNWDELSASFQVMTYSFSGILLQVLRHSFGHCVKEW